MEEGPLKELLADLEGDEPGSLAGHVSRALEFARDHLLDATEGAGSGALDGALDQISDAVRALRAYLARLEELAGGLESIERDVGLLESGGALLGEDGEVHPPNA
jgi:hypothetical protein